jgi:pimeloyl-ACP methyl ester carboxylesterase
MPKIPVSDIQLYFEEHGQVDPLILIPGFAAGAWIWFKQVEPLSRKFRVITFDPRGIGQSDYSEGSATIRLMADDVAALLRGLKIERAHILGASFGGFVAQELALAYPEMTCTLLLCCTSFGGPKHVAPSVETLMALASTNGFNTEERIRRSFLPAFSPEFAREQPDEIENVVKLRLANPVNESAYRGQFAAAMGFNAEFRVPEIKTPTLVISGDADAIVPVQNSHNLAAQIPKAQLKIVGGGSHAFFIERPDEFNRIVSEFIQSK